MSRPARPSVARAFAPGLLVVLLGLTGCTAAGRSTASTTGAQVGSTAAPGSEAGTGHSMATPGAAGSEGTSVGTQSSSGAQPSPTTAPGREQGPAPSGPPVITLPGLDAAAAPAPAAGPALTGPAPATAQRNGAVVAGFPVRVVPVPKGVTVVSSSVSSQGEHVQLSMEASSSLSPAQVLSVYDEALGGTGFTPTNTPAVPGSAAHAYLHGTDGVVVTVKARLGGGTEITLAGALTTAG